MCIKQNGTDSTHCYKRQNSGPNTLLSHIFNTHTHFKTTTHAIMWTFPFFRLCVVSDRADLDGSDGGRASAYLAYLSNPANGYRIASITIKAFGQSFTHDLAVCA